MTDPAPITPPGPRGLGLIRALWRMKTSRLAFLSQMAHDFGGVVRFSVPGRTIYLVSEPSAARHILVTNVGNYSKGLGQREATPLLGTGLLTADDGTWPRQRRALEALFNPARMADLIRGAIPAVEELSSSWTACAREGTTTELIRDVKEVALRIIDNFLLAGGLASHISAAISKLGQFEHLVTADVLSPWPSAPNVPFSRAARLRSVVADLHRIIDQVIDHCGAVGGDNVVTCMRREWSPTPDDDALRSQVATFILAGYETTAAALAWVWVLLDRYPKTGLHVRRELQAELGGRVPTLTDIGRLAYTRAVVLEALRLFPPVWVLPRTAIHADTVSGFALPPGTEVLISPYLIHRRPDLWSDPEAFLPERFLADRLQPRTPCAYLPFGVGPRSCIGSQTAVIEVVFAVAALAQRFRLTSAGRARRGPQPQLSLFPGTTQTMRVQAV